MKRADFDPQQGSVLRKALIVLLVVMVALGAWLFFSQDRGNKASNSAARQAADQFTTYLVNQDKTSSYDMMAEVSRAVTPVETWNEWVDVSFEGATKAEFSSEEPVVDPQATYGDLPVVRYLYTFEINGQEYTAPIVLIEKDRVWQVSSVGAFE